MTSGNAVSLTHPAASSHYDGDYLREMVRWATLWLEKSSREIDALNVFPVPDGDTGTNMVLTMRSVLEEAQHLSGNSVAATAQAMARGALMGARGNSGVILSQFFRGLAQGLEGKESFSPADLAQALSRGAVLAYQGLSQPVEGTILTVIRETAEAALGAVRNGTDLPSLLETATAAAAQSVARTPTLLPVLRQAGVVDAGGQGFYVLLEGMLRLLKGEKLEEGQPSLIAPSLPIMLTGEVAEEESYGYCTEFLLTGEKLNAEGVRQRLEGKGKSLIVAGDPTALKVHIHTCDPGGVLRFATRLGTLHDIQINNMDDQHREFLERRRAAAPTVAIAIVAVTWGEGIAKVFHSLGVTAAVPGGKTMNPSTRELLRAVEAVPSQQVIILPNNKNVIPAAGQVVSLTAKQVVVVPTETLPQGIASLLAFSPAADLAANAQAMERAGRRVLTLEITRAVRGTAVGEMKVKKGQSIALIEGQLIAAATSPVAVISQLLQRAEVQGKEVATLFQGADTPAQEAQEIAQLFRSAGFGEVEVLDGGQPYYDYIISLE